MPPFRFFSFVKPCWRRNAIALALRMPLLQWTTISRFAVQLAEALRQLRQRHQRAAGDPADLELLRVAHVEDEDLLAAVEPRLQLLDRRLAARRPAAGGGASWPRMPQNCS